MYPYSSDRSTQSECDRKWWDNTRINEHPKSELNNVEGNNEQDALVRLPAVLSTMRDSHDYSRITHSIGHSSSVTTPISVDQDIVSLGLGRLEEKGRSLSDEVVKAFVTTVKKAYRAMPLTKYKKIIEASQYVGHNIQLIQQFIQLFIDFQDKEDLKKTYGSYLSGKTSMTNLFQTLNVYRDQYLLKKFPEKDLDLICEEFLKINTTTNDDDSSGTTITSNQLENFRKIFAKIDQKKSSLSKLPEASLKNIILRVKTEAARSGDEFSLIVERLAIAREVINRCFNIMPYNTQIFAVLGLILHKVNQSGRIAQVKTGEGKSTLVALLAAFYAMQDRKIDIISSSRPLASRDAKKYEEYFSFYGITSGHICVDQPTNEHFTPQIIYGTNTDFEFSILRDLTNKEKTRAHPVSNESRSQDIVIVDEIDNLLIDKGENSAIISIPGKDDYLPIIRDIYDFAQTNYADFYQHDASILASKVIAHCRSTEVPNDQLLERIPIEKLEHWIMECKKALFSIEENKHYVVKYPSKSVGTTRSTPSIIIIEQVTGQLQEGSRWNRLHQFLELKHNLQVEPDTISSAELSHPVFFGQYRKIIGLTGTIGNKAEREEVSKVYKVDSFDVPPHKTAKRVCYEPVLVENEKQHRERILDELQIMNQSGRPCLVLTQDIQSCRTLSKFLQQHDYAHQVYDAIQVEDEEFLVSKAGFPGAVTLATNTAGRGTDIKILPECLFSGGLHVIMSFYPESFRVEEQGVGRAARQGQPGSSRIIANREEIDKKLLPITGDKKIFELLAEKRDFLAIKESEIRVSRGERSNHNYYLLKKFTAVYENWQSRLDQSLIKEVAMELRHKINKKDVADSMVDINDTSIENRIRTSLFAQANHHSNQMEFDKDVLINFTARVLNEISQEILIHWARLFSEITRESKPDMNEKEAIKRYLMDSERSVDSFIKNLNEELISNTKNTVVRLICDIILEPQGGQIENIFKFKRSSQL